MKTRLAKDVRNTIQSIEKFLKAFLLSKGWALKRVHDLEVLLNEALTYDPSVEQFRSVCQKIIRNSIKGDPVS